MRMRIFLLIVAVLAGAAACAQQPTAVAGAEFQPFAAAEVHPDRKVTFRVAAPRASEVQVVFGHPRLTNPRPMAKGADGVWSITIGPVEPELYAYSFLVDGLRVDIAKLDADNSVEVPGTPPRFDEVHNVPHGSVNMHTYFGTVQDRSRGIYVYVPPQYYTEINRKFPVLYLWYSLWETEWTRYGRANIILDNLIAEKKASPMIVVMPNNIVESTLRLERSAVIEKELVADIIPFVEKNYRVLSGRNNRAIAGLSAGGATAFTVGMRQLDKFGSVAEFSTGVFGGLPPTPNGGYAPYDPEKIAPGMYKNLVSPATKLKLLYMSVGTEDPRLVSQKAALADFQKHGIEPVFKTFAGAHEWSVWRHSLADMASMLFK